MPQPINNSCPRCGARIAEDTVMCPGCGTEFVITCPKCSLPNPMTNAACFSCATPFTQTQENNFSPAAKSNNMTRMVATNISSTPKLTSFAESAKKAEGRPKKEKSSFSFALKIAGALFVVLIVAFILLRPVIAKVLLTANAEKYLNALNRSDFNEAYGLLSAPSQQLLDRDVYVKFLNGNPNISGAVFSNLKEVRKDDKTAVFTYDVSIGNTKSVRDIFLNKEGYNWKISAKTWFIAKADADMEAGNFSEVEQDLKNLDIIDTSDNRLNFYRCALAFSQANYAGVSSFCDKAAGGNHTAAVKLSPTQFLQMDYFNTVKLYHGGSLDEAFAKAENMIKANNVSAPLLCKAYDLRVKILTEKSKYEQLKDELVAALGKCKNTDYNKKLSILNGNATELAVETAKNVSVDGPSTGLAFVNMLLNLDASANRYTVKPELVWTAQHLKGAFYNVSVTGAGGRIRNQPAKSKRYAFIAVDVINPKANILDSLTESQMNPAQKQTVAKTKKTARRKR